MSAEAWANVLTFLVGLVGCIGLVASWPGTLLWIILLALGWGVLIISNCDGLLD
ncbi:membrane protein [Streptomyces phage Alone3]|nr:membrane protein [Streptomyces phage Alone3]